TSLFETCTLDGTTILAFRDFLRAPQVCTFLPHIRKIRARRSFRHPTTTISTRSPAPLVAMLSLFPALQVLHVREVSPRGLHSLQLCTRATDPILAWLHRFNHLPNIDSLELALLQHTHVPVVHAALQQARGAIQHLNIDLTSLLGAPSQLMFGLSLHPNLRTLAVFHVDMGDFDPAMFMVFIKTLIAPALEVLSLELVPLLRRGIDWRRWTCFCARRSFSSPCRGHLTRDVPHDMHDNLREVLPLLGAAGVLKMEWFIHSLTLRILRQ
ncbi:hypothetical protein B0H13DRAFT_2027650, partial [Mycena leptocephala]